MTNLQPGPELEDALTRMRRYVTEAGRDWGSFGLAGRTTVGEDPALAVQRCQAWREAGATHVAISTMGAGLSACSAHLERLARFRDAWARRAGHPETTPTKEAHGE